MNIRLNTKIVILLAALLGCGQTRAAELLKEEHFERLDSSRWKIEGRGNTGFSEGALVLKDCEAVAGQADWGDYELSFRARAPKDADQAQIWASVRRTARDSRYAIGVRGGNIQQIYVARYAPKGRLAFLGLRPLGFDLKPGEWCQVRITVVGQTLRIYLNQNPKPAMEVFDKEVGWLEHGGIALGGGFVPTEYQEVEVKSITESQPAVALSSTTSASTAALSDVETEARRKQLREAYQPVQIGKIDGVRSEISLNGKWLFLPDYEFQKEVNYGAQTLDDTQWHTMDVPALWTPLDNWCYKSDEPDGGSDHWVEMEKKRLNQYSFDWKKTTAAWYRHSFELKALPAGNRFELCFDAIAKISEIWVNGHFVGRNLGMFHPIQMDITSFVQAGRNTIAVRVGSIGSDEKKSGADKVAAVAVSVTVTEGMLRSLPQGMYKGKPGGIWQPAKLVIHQNVQIKDLFFQPQLNGAKVELTLENKSDSPCEVTPQLSFTSKQTGAEMHPQAGFSPVNLKPGEVKTVTVDTGKLEPELWSPSKPNLYALRATLKSGEKIVDEQRLEVGFRTFEARKDGKLYLNGKPYWLRGANPAPMPNCPNDAAMAEKFTKLMNAANVRVTRTHIAPWDELWLSCADRNGVGVSQEGTWPWLGLNGNMPKSELVDCWRQENVGLIRKYRNHPSILFWTVNNESYFVGYKDPQKLETMVTQLSSIIKAMRVADPTRPVCPDSGGAYAMFKPFFEKIAQEKRLDYGDIDDKHDYTSWYTKSFFQHYPGQLYLDNNFMNHSYPEQMRKWMTAGRPLISQEMTTGYPNADDGHAIRNYIFKHIVAQSWVGDYAYEHNDPKYLLASIAFNTKELAETLRCYYRDSMAGVIHFSLNTWYQNPFEVDRIRPYEPAKALAKGLQPVLVSARLFGRHFFAGAKPEVNFFVVNDDEDGHDLGPTRLTWAIEENGQTVTNGEQALPAVPYYANQACTVTIQMPASLPQPRVAAKLVLHLYEKEKLVSQNDYDLTLADKGWVKSDADPRVFDAEHQSEPIWKTLGVKPQWTDSIPSEVDSKGLVFCDYDWVSDKVQRDRFLSYVAAGGHVVLIAPGQSLKRIFPELITSFRKMDGEIVEMRVPESPAFDGIEVRDMRWFDGGDQNTPIATHGDFNLVESPQIEILAKHNPAHCYIYSQQDKAAMEGAALFTISHGKGQVVVTQLAHETGVRDPIAARILRNLLVQDSNSRH